LIVRRQLIKRVKKQNTVTAVSWLGA